MREKEEREIAVETENDEKKEKVGVWHLFRVDWVVTEECSSGQWVSPGAPSCLGKTTIFFKNKKTNFLILLFKV